MKCKACGHSHLDPENDWKDDKTEPFISVSSDHNLYACPKCYTVIYNA